MSFVHARTSRWGSGKFQFFYFIANYCCCQTHRISILSILLKKLKCWYNSTGVIEA